MRRPPQTGSDGRGEGSNRVAELQPQSLPIDARRPERATLDWRILVFVIGLHIATAVFYKVAAGVSIEANPGGRSWDWWWQTVPSDLLRTDLWRSLWYLHSQPPLFNLYGAFFFHAFPTDPMSALQYGNILLGAGMVGMLYAALIYLTGNRWLSAIGGVLLALDPGLLLFEAYILYDLLTAFLVVGSVFTLLVYARTRRLVFAGLFALDLAVLVMTRSAYHLAIVPVGLALAAAAVPGKARRALALGGLVSLLPTGLYLKNLVLFGFFGASSWMGFGLWKVASQGYGPDELRSLAGRGVIAPVAAEVEIFRPASRYTPYGYTRTSLIPVLSRDDQRNIIMVEVAQDYLHSAVQLIRANPSAYLRSVLQSFRIFALPSAGFKHLSLNRERMGLHATLVADWLQGGRLANSLPVPLGSLYVVIIPLVIVGYGAWFLGRVTQARESVASILRRAPVETWIIALVSYTTLVSVLLEVGENNRERFYVEQILSLLLIVVGYRVYRRWRGRR